MSAYSAAPMTFGQLSVWYDVAQMPPSRRHEANLLRTGPVDPGTRVADLLNAFRELRTRHEALRTRYDFSDPTRPRQLVRAADNADLPVRCMQVPRDTDPATAAREIGEELARQPFDLTAEDSWRVAILLAGDEPVHLVAVLHHIAVDLWAMDLLDDDFQTLLRGGRPGPADSPRALARDQRSTAWRARNSAAARHLRTTYTAVARAGTAGIVESPASAVKVTLRSSIALPLARTRANALGISMPALALAAYCFAAHQLTGSDTVLVNAMCANRLYPGTTALVSSMNQWAVCASHRYPTESFDEFARRTHWTYVRASRHGCYDPFLAEQIRTEVAASVGPLQPQFWFNFVDAGPVEPDPAAPRTDAPPWSVTQEDPLRLTGPSFYLVVTRAADLSLSCRVMWAGFDAAALESFLVSVHALLSAPAELPRTGRGGAIAT
jgi:hypothetical protein